MKNNVDVSKASGRRYSSHQMPNEIVKIRENISRRLKRLHNRLHDDQIKQSEMSLSKRRTKWKIRFQSPPVDGTINAINNKQTQNSRCRYHVIEVSIKSNAKEFLFIHSPRFLISSISFFVFLRFLAITVDITCCSMYQQRRVKNFCHNSRQHTISTKPHSGRREKKNRPPK